MNTKNMQLRIEEKIKESNIEIIILEVVDSKIKVL